MQYPLISEYVRAIQDASSNLDKLAHLVPVLDDHGEPYRSSGAFAVVFKMKDEQTGKCYALKCFTEEQEGRAEAYRQIADELEFVDSSYITSVKYLEKEIFVDSSCEEDEFPVLLMDWIDGETMESYIAENYQDNYAMAMLCYRFCKMAAWLRSQPFAHGDIKPDNIMVRPDGSLTLVDYDGMFVPAMKGQKSPTIGTKDFSHPLRTVDDFDETIDDFALASIALSLKAISLESSLFDDYGAADRLLFSAEDYRDLSKSKVLSALQELVNDEEFSMFYAMFLLVNAKKRLRNIDVSIYVECKMPLFKNLSTLYTEIEVKDAVPDIFGVLYSKDGKKLISAGKLQGVTCYSIPEGCAIICDKAFYMCLSLKKVFLSKSIVAIGNNAFEGCSVLDKIVLTPNIVSIGDSAFAMCLSLNSLVIPLSVKRLKGNPFFCWDGKLTILSPYFIYENGVVFSKHRHRIVTYRGSTDSYIIPSSVIVIGKKSFEYRENLKEIIIPNNVEHIETGAFEGCENLTKILLGHNLKSIGDRAFWGCSSLASISIPKSVKYIGESAFWACSFLKNINVMSEDVKIGKCAFVNCFSLKQEIKLNLISRFGKEVFGG